MYLFSRTRFAQFKGAVSHRAEADSLLAKPGDVVLVVRGTPRSLVMKCPDGCGDTITVNLDRRAGKAWSFYDADGTITLYPSVWRDSGCRAHFILWSNTIFWTDRDRLVGTTNSELRDKVILLLNSNFQSYADVAAKLNCVPWEVLVTCYELEEEGLAEEHPLNRGHFRLAHR